MKYLLMVAAALAASGCSTVIRGTKETARFESTPPGATVTATRITDNDDNPVACIAPCKLQLSRKRDFYVTFELDGYKPVTAKLSSLVTPGGGVGFLGNAVAGGVVGGVVDAGTGALHDLRPNPMRATLAPADQFGASLVAKVDDKDQVSGKAALDVKLGVYKMKDAVKAQAAAAANPPMVEAAPVSVQTVTTETITTKTTNSSTTQ